MDQRSPEERAFSVLSLLLRELPDPTENGDSFVKVIEWGDEMTKTIQASLDADSIWAFVNLVYEHIDQIRRRENAVKGGVASAQARPHKVTDKQIQAVYDRYKQAGKDAREMAGAIALQLGISTTTVRTRLTKLGLKEKRKST